jgi:hypothetical protein
VDFVCDADESFGRAASLVRPSDIRDFCPPSIGFAVSVGHTVRVWQQMDERFVGILAIPEIVR